jgi:hypothetical protein
MVLNRIDVSMVAFKRPQDMGYFPSWMEFAVSLGIVAAGVLLFIFFVEHFRVYVGEETTHVDEKPSFDPAGISNLLPPALAAPRRFSLAAIAGAAAAVLFLPGQAFTGATPTRTAVQPPRAIEATVVPGAAHARRRLLLTEATAPLPADARRERVLMIDGNRNGDAVLFDHEKHVERLHGDDSCKECHHLNLPFDEQAPCYPCHRDMYEPTSTFDHAFHVRQLDGTAGCVKCHKDPRAVKTLETATPCADCHRDLVVAGSRIEAPHDVWRAAAGYVEAMHGLCVKCHEERVREHPADTPQHLERCDTCHDADRAVELDRMKPHDAGRGGDGSTHAIASRAIR